MTTLSSQYKREFNDLVKNNKIHRFVTQLQFCKDPSDIKKIKEILSNLQLVSNETGSNSDSKLKEYLQKIDTYQYKKQWNRLKSFQKEDRLLKFIDEKKISKDVRDQLLKMHEDGKLKSTKDVNYDCSKGEIVSLKCLYQDDKGSYFIAPTKPTTKKVKKET